MTTSQKADSYFLQLSSHPIRFEPVSKVTNIFFDGENKQVFAVRSGGATGVVVKGPDVRTSISFRMEAKGDVFSIKFSPDKKILAVQRTENSVEFMNFTDEIDGIEYSQTCKGKSTKVLGFVWTTPNEVIFVTDHGIELYQVIPEKRMLRSLKSHSVSVNWFVYHSESGMLLLSSGTLGNIIHMIQCKPGAFYRLPKFEVDLPAIPKPPGLCLLERDVAMASVYGKTCIIILRHQTRAKSAGAEFVIYTVQREGPPRKTDILKLDMSGRFGINVIDNLIIVHHQASKTSVLFDIRLPGETDGFVTYHHPLTKPCPIKPFKMRIQGLPTQEPEEINCEMYSPNWAVFQPNIVIDAKLGCFWYVQLHMDPLVDLISNKVLLIDFLLMRRDSKPVILKVCRQALSPVKQQSLVVLSKIFDRLNHVYKAHLDRELNLQVGAASLESSASASGNKLQTVLVDQSDIYTHCFSIFSENTEIGYKFIIAVLLEYIRSLCQHQIPVNQHFYELFSKTLEKHSCYYALHQFLQYHVLTDSKDLACFLLSIKNRYPPAHQLALDMLKRLGDFDDQILDILLEGQHVLEALRFVRSTGNPDAISAHKFLNAAINTGDPAIFFSVFKFFEQRNIRLRGTPAFAKGEQCDAFVKHFDILFGQTVP